MAEDGPSPAKRLRVADSAFEVEVGAAPLDQIYTLDIELFTQRSSFFKAALSSSWRQADAPVDLTDQDKHTFELYLRYIRQAGLRDEEHNADTVFADASGLFDLYILADKLGDLTAANATIDELIRQSDHQSLLPEGNLVDTTYHAVAQGCPLRKLLVDWFAHDAGDSITGEFLSREMLVEIFRECTRARHLVVDEHYCDPHDPDDAGLFRNVSGLVEREKCRYHQHDVDHPKCAEDEEESSNSSETS